MRREGAAGAAFRDRGGRLGGVSSVSDFPAPVTKDLGGNRLTLSLDGTLFVSYAYDDASRLTTITRGSSNVGFGYDNANRRTSMTYPNGITTNYTYDTVNRLTRLKADLGATPITDFQYTYDDAGNRKKKQQLDYTEDYSYDPLYRLTGVERSAGLTGIWHFGYDAVGNRLTNQINDSVLTSVFSEKNQLTSSSGGGTLRVRGTLNEPGTANVNGSPARMLAGNVFEATIQATTGTNTFAVEATDQSGNVSNKNYQVSVSATGATYTYDPNGNLTQKVEGADTWTYTWDAENRLKKVEKNAVEQARFAYDPRGRRVEKVAGGVTTSWTYDGSEILREAAGSTTLKYVFGPGIDEPLATDDGSALSYFHADALGSVAKTTSAAGVVTLTRRYDAWGNLELGATTSGFAFTGREHDAQTGLAYYRARYYDPKLGRFISEDPLGQVEGPNLYEYVHNNPANFTDPEGLAAMKNNSNQAIPYKPENEDNMPVRMCPPGEWCNVDGVYSPPGSPQRCPIKIPDNCIAWVNSKGELKVVCLVPSYRSPEVLSPPTLGSKDFQNWPDPYTGRNWPLPPWDPNKECKCKP